MALGTALDREGKGRCVTFEAMSVCNCLGNWSKVGRHFHFDGGGLRPLPSNKEAAAWPICVIARLALSPLWHTVMEMCSASHGSTVVLNLSTSSRLSSLETNEAGRRRRAPRQQEAGVGRARWWV